MKTELNEERVAALEKKLLPLPDHMKNGDEPLILALCAYWRETQPKFEPSVDLVCRHCGHPKNRHEFLQSFVGVDPFEPAGPQQ